MGKHLIIEPIRQRPTDPAATSRRLMPSSNVNRKTSRIFFIDTRSAGIAHPLVAREIEPLIRMSTGAYFRPLSPSVRNHHARVRFPPSPVSALNRISQPRRGRGWPVGAS